MALLDGFTGIPPLDYLLRTLVVFFWEATDGSHPAVTATGLYFVGQLFPIIVAIYLDGLRHANGPSLARPTAWFFVFVFGAAAIGASGAAWALVYTTASLTTSVSVSANDLRRASLISSPRAAALLLPAAVLGYVVPVILMGLPSPSVVSDEFRQWAIVLWNTFPLLMLGLVMVGERVLDAALPPPSSASKSSYQAHLRVVRWLGALSVAVGFALHVAVAAMSASTALFPTLFASEYGRELTPWALGALPLSLAAGDTVGDGIRGFMYWDQVFGYSLVLLVFLAQLRNAARVSEFRHASWAGFVAASALSSLLLGPGTTVIAVSWLRDEILFGGQALKEEQVNKKRL